MKSGEREKEINQKKEKLRGERWSVKEKAIDGARNARTGEAYQKNSASG